MRTELSEAITVRLPADVQGRKLLTLEQSLDNNIKMLNSTVNGVIEEITEYVERAECVVRLTQDRHRNTLIIAAASQNLTTQYRRIVNDINQRTHFVVKYGVCATGSYVIASSCLLADFLNSAVDVKESFRLLSCYRS